MKKNNKFRNNGNSNAYSLNYKFDSVSPAGKYNGTALDLIKRYNELAKEAHSSGNYIEMEVFRQYAEHYRKIVTEINERKNLHQEMAASENTANQTSPAPEENSDTASNTATPVQANQEINPPAAENGSKKSFKIVEIRSNGSDHPIAAKKGPETNVTNVSAPTEPESSIKQTTPLKLKRKPRAKNLADDNCAENPAAVG